MLRNTNNSLLNKWAINVKNLLAELGFANLWSCVNLTNVHIKAIEQRIYDQYLQQWCSNIEDSRKLECYKRFKTNFNFEPYLVAVENDSHRIAFSRLRCSSHKLQIEEGRYRNVPRANRLCRKCNSNHIESEYHFVLVCPYYTELRRSFIHRQYYTWPNVNKFNALMSSTHKKTIVNLAKFVFLAFKRRND